MLAAVETLPAFHELSTGDRRPWVPTGDAPLPKAAGYPERFPVPAGQRLWERQYDNYSPAHYESPRVLAMDRTVVPGGWADPQGLTREDFIQLHSTGHFRSYEGIITLDPESGRPLNPTGRTGICGRGLLGKWGANQAADALLTRIHPVTGELEALLIERDCGKWAIPGGMLDDGEDALTAARRELTEEAGLAVDDYEGVLVYQGIGDGPRTTDNAWIETSLYHFHIPADVAAMMIPRAGSDAMAAQWKTVSMDLIQNLYANHGDLMLRALSQMRIGEGAAAGGVHAKQLLGIPHIPELTSFSALHGRIGIIGGTFDPVQIGHIYAAQAAQDARELDAVVFVPVAQNPAKETEPGALPRERLEMVSRAIENNPRMFVSPIEIRKGGLSYTIETVRKIRNELPADSELFFIIGQDCIPGLPHWEGFEELKQLVTFIPIQRIGKSGTPGCLSDGSELSEFQRELYRNRVGGMGIDISSSELRREIRAGLYDDPSLPDGVADYIAKRRLYRAP